MFGLPGEERTLQSRVKVGRLGEDQSNGSLFPATLPVLRSPTLLISLHWTPIGSATVGRRGSIMFDIKNDKTCVTDPPQIILKRPALQPGNSWRPLLPIQGRPALTWIGTGRGSTTKVLSDSVWIPCHRILAGNYRPVVTQ